MYVAKEIITSNYPLLGSVRYLIALPIINKTIEQVHISIDIY